MSYFRLAGTSTTDWVTGRGIGCPPLRTAKSWHYGRLADPKKLPIQVKTLNNEPNSRGRNSIPTLHNRASKPQPVALTPKIAMIIGRDRKERATGSR
jgi:hypothetical protein